MRTIKQCGGQSALRKVVTVQVDRSFSNTGHWFQERHAILAYSGHSYSWSFSLPLADGDSKSELTNGHSNGNTEHCHHGDKKTEQSVDVEKTDGSKVIANGDIQHGEIPPINQRECNDALTQC